MRSQGDHSYLGDARATQVSQYGEHNVGQLARERFGDDCHNVGFSTFTGSVTAASDWGGDAEHKFVRPGLEGSYECLFHELEAPQFSLNLREHQPQMLNQSRLQRAIEVIYRPETERQSHYFYAQVAKQFDSLIYIDTTKALAPLDMTDTWKEQ